MPNKCCVMGCTGKYQSNKEKVHTFIIPKDEELKMKWLNAIGRKNFKLGRWSVVCHKHFQESDIIKQCIETELKSGAKVFFSSRVKLKEGAIPCLNLNIDNTAQEIPASRTSPRKSHSSKTIGPTSDHDSSDDDTPLEKLRNQIIHPPDNSNVRDTDNQIPGDSDKSLKKKFKKLLEDYEHLKNKSIGIDQEIRVLEQVNIELKCNVFRS